MNNSIVFHGTTDIINNFDSAYSGDNTANNDYECFFFTDNYEVAEDYSRQAFIRRYDHSSLEELIEYSKFSESNAQKIIDDLDEEAENNLKVIEAKINFNNPFILDLNYANLDIIKTQTIIGHLKGKLLDDETHELIYDSLNLEYDEENDEYPEYEEFDGLIIKNCIDDIGYQSQQYQTEYIAFYDYQIQIINN